jgi:hypothetical protein
MDLSGNGNNGAINNATWVAGKYGGGLLFNGSTSIVTVPNSASLNIKASVTLEAWVDPSSLVSPDDNWALVVGKEQTKTANDINYALYAAQGTNTPPGGNVVVGTTVHQTTGGSPLMLNTWAFVAMTYDGTTLRSYLNGALISSATIGGAMASTTDPLTIGGDAAKEMFSGIIDEVRIYNTTLTAAQIQSDMAPPGLTHSLSGSITPTAGGAGATITVTGAASATVTTDPSGNYSFAGLPDGAYTVTASKSGYSFSPASQPVTVAGSNVTGVNFTATASPAGIQLVQTAVNGNELGTASMAVSLSVHAGDFLIVTGTAAQPSSTLTITDSLANTFLSAITPVVDPAQNVQAYVWYVQVARGGADTLTITPSVISALEIHVSEYSGLSATASVDQVSSATGSGTVISSGSKTTAASSELVFGYAWVLNTALVGPSFSSLSLVNGDLDEYLVQGTAGAVDAKFTQSAAGSWLAIMVIFKP